MKGAGQKLYEQWCGGSYVWEALSEIEQQRWEWLAGNFQYQKLASLKEGARRAAGVSSLDTQLPRENDPGEKKTRYAVAQAILTTAEQWTEADL